MGGQQAGVPRPSTGERIPCGSREDRCFGSSNSNRANWGIRCHIGCNSEDWCSSSCRLGCGEKTHRGIKGSYRCELKEGMSRVNEPNGSDTIPRVLIDI